jgi:hypothetical protein
MHTFMIERFVVNSVFEPDRYGMQNRFSNMKKHIRLYGIYKITNRGVDWLAEDSRQMPSRHRGLCAASFDYGRLQKKELSFPIKANCANGGRPIEIALDSKLNIHHVTHGSDPMFCLPIVSLANTKKPSIVDIF